jgi:hypothetical protein
VRRDPGAWPPEPSSRSILEKLAFSSNSWCNSLVSFLRPAGGDQSHTTLAEQLFDAKVANATAAVGATGIVETRSVRGVAVDSVFDSAVDFDGSTRAEPIPCERHGSILMRVGWRRAKGTKHSGSRGRKGG